MTCKMLDDICSNCVVPSSNMAAMAAILNIFNQTAEISK